MEINVDNERKLVELWLSHDEQDDPVFMETLKPRYREYADRKYLVAVFQSGSRDLYQATSDLLCYNRKRIHGLKPKKERGKASR